MHHSGMLRVIKHHLPSHPSYPGAPWMHSCGNKSQLQSLHTCSAWSSVNTPGRSAELQCGGHNKSAGPSLACDSPAPVIAVSPVRQNKSIGPSDQMGIFLRAQSVHTASVTGLVALNEQDESIVRNNHKTGSSDKQRFVTQKAFARLLHCRKHWATDDRIPPLPRFISFIKRSFLNGVTEITTP